MISNTRLSILAGLFGLMAVAIVGRVTQLQFTQDNDMARTTREQVTSSYTERGARGRILDRQGGVLAYSQEARMVQIDHLKLNSVHPALIEPLAAALSASLKRPIEPLRKQLTTIATETQAYERVQRATPGGLFTRTVNALIEPSISLSTTNSLTRALATTVTLPYDRDRVVSLADYVRIAPSWKRVYPQAELAGAVLGTTRIDDGNESGLLGIEQQYNDDLAPHDGLRVSRGLDRNVEPMVPGADVVLTIDPQLQAYAEQRMQKALRDFGARSGVAIVMDTETGAIYALAEASSSQPAFNPNTILNQLFSGESKHIGVHAGVAVAEEPGSIMKPLTILSTVEVGKLRPSYNDGGSLNVRGGPPVRNLGNAAYGDADAVRTLAYSINTIIARMALEMGPETFYNQIQAYGFNNRTFIDLPGEATGVMRRPDKPLAKGEPAWTESDMARDSYGQSLVSTPIQNIVAMNVIANDCRRVRPFLVRELRRESGVDHTLTDSQTAVCRPESARKVRDIMGAATKQVIENAKVKPRIPGYSYAGKTGTADRTNNIGTTVTTYAGFIPAKSPKLTILVKVADPTVATLAGDVAQPVWRDLAQYAVTLLNVPPDEVIK